MLSATFSRSARQLAREYLRDESVRINVGRAGSSHANVTQEVIFVEGRDKLKELENFLRSMDQDLVLVFCNSKPAVDKVDDYLYRAELPTAFLHGDRTQFEREDALRAFFRKDPPILVTTAVMARGIDFSGVAVVVNYDLPSTQYGGIDEYVHRIGRTGRAGKTGTSISFACEEDAFALPSIEKAINQKFDCQYPPAELLNNIS